ncbi:glycine zipper 2TM domain-containing protein [Ottowia sp.]|uniref:glycine zipper 2TM domain-containing protein n=1 Tax=Ottowia sp. TaxID=1898956 RepID=UPI003A8364C1
MTIPSRLTSSLAAVGVAALLAACAAPGPQAYPAQPAASTAGQMSGYGRVTNVEFVQGGQSSGLTGAVIGGAVGGLAGNQIGGGSGRTVATVAGVVGGALVGRHLEQNANRNTVNHYRVSVQFDNGGARSFDFAEPPNVQVGDRVRAEGNQLYR